MGSFKKGWVCVGRPWSWGQWAPKSWWIFLTSGRDLPPPAKVASHLWYWPLNPLPSFQGINHALPEETLMACSWGSCHVRHGSFSSGPTSIPLFASGPIIRLKSQQAPKNEVWSVTQWGLQKNTLNFLNSENMCGNNGGRNIKLNQVKFNDTGSLNRDSVFNIAAQGVRKGCQNVLAGWLKHGPKDSPQWVNWNSQTCLGLM